MPSAEFDGSPLPLLPFGCIFKSWFRYHDGEPNIEFGNFFAHLVRVYPTGPTTVRGTVETHKTLCNEAASLLECIGCGEAKKVLPNSGGPWRQPQDYNLKQTYRAIIIMMDQYVDPGSKRDFATLISLDEHSKKQTVCSSGPETTPISVLQPTLRS